jgi:Protein of unknown function (DUF4058)
MPNPYPGINAHLNSLLQTPGTIDQPSMWPGFHSYHIPHIAAALVAQLPPHYFVMPEQSLQIRSSDAEESRHPKPDITIFQRNQPGREAVGVLEVAPTWEGVVADIIEPIKQVKAVVIRELLPQHKLGRIVARIELLSPSNKPRGSNYEAYSVNRVRALEEGIPLIEIDYLHESPPIVMSRSEVYPYWIIVTDPRPDWNLGKARGYGFHVDEPIKKFVLPLSGNEKIVFDLNPVYERTFQDGGWANLLDYAVEPERFQTYSASDQAFIRQIMVQISSGQ